MNLTRAQIYALPDSPQRRGLIASLNPDGGPRSSRKIKLDAAIKEHQSGMNKWEREYANRLSLNRSVVWYAYEGVKLKLASSCFYTPDFSVLTDGESPLCMEFHEVKGYQRDDAVVKFKTASKMYPHFIFRMFVKKNGGWEQARALLAGEPI